MLVPKLKELDWFCFASKFLPGSNFTLCLNQSLSEFDVLLKNETNFVPSALASLTLQETWPSLTNATDLQSSAKKRYSVVFSRPIFRAASLVLVSETNLGETSTEEPTMLWFASHSPACISDTE